MKTELIYIVRMRSVRDARQQHLRQLVSRTFVAYIIKYAQRHQIMKEIIAATVWTQHNPVYREAYNMPHIERVVNKL